MTSTVSKEKTYEVETGGTRDNDEKKSAYPKAVAFIIGNEFCERFSFYGMRTVLVLYFTNILRYPDDDATQAYHIFVMCAYFMPLIGATIADTLLGKFHTIMYISLIYAAGNFLLAFASIKGTAWLTFVGLALIAFGTGGIKPCVAAFGGDQFKPHQSAQLVTFFSMFYVAINAGSLLSTALTPILREDVHCLGEESCFPLAFGLPAILMLVAIVFFIVGDFLTTYVKVPPGKENVIMTVFRIIGFSLSNRKGPTRDHWLDYAEEKYDPKTISQVKTLLSILLLYIPLPFFWALFDQQSSRWTLQARSLNGNLGGWAIKPDQLQVLNPFLVILLVPVFDKFVYPFTKKTGFMNRPLQRMIMGGLLAALSFFACSILQMQIEQSAPTELSSGNAHFIFVNQLKCNININNKFPFESSFFVAENQPLEWLNENVAFAVSGENCKAGTYQVKMNATGKVGYDSNKRASFVVYLNEDLYDNKASVSSYENIIDKPMGGGAKMFVVFDFASFDLWENQTYQLTSDGVKDKIKMNDTFNLKSGAMFGSFESYEVSVSNQQIKMSLKGENSNTHFPAMDLKPGAVYVTILKGDLKTPDNIIVDYNKVVEESKISVFWQLIQFFIMTCGELMFSITGLEFSYSQAPKEMKSVIQAAWLLTTAVGNLIVAVLAKIKIGSLSTQFIFYGVLMLVDMGVFAIMAYYYTPSKKEEDSPDNLSLENVRKTSDADQNRNRTNSS